MPNVLVTGGAGYVGSHCVKLLVDKGYDCTVFDNLSRGHSEFVKWCPLVVGDIRNSDQLDLLFERNNFDAIIHFAGLSYVNESLVDPLAYWDNNVFGTKTLLTSALKAGVKNVVFSSSCAVYGQPSVIPITELTPLNPINPYGYTKLACEILLRHLHTSFGLNFISFRYFNAAGADIDSGLGEWHDPETHIIPLVISNALNNKIKLKIFGDDFPTSDGFAIRDFVHVKDLASAHELGLQYLLGGGYSQAINLGTGQGSSILDIIKIVSNKLGVDVLYEVSQKRVGDPAELVAQADLAFSVLKWKSRYSLSDILSDAINWHSLA